MIIAGFAGVGKTTLAKHYPELFIDLNVAPYKYSNFSIDQCGEEHKGNYDATLVVNWEEAYLKDALRLNADGKHVLIVPDTVVLKALRQHGIHYMLVYPNSSLRDDYEALFTRRGNCNRFQAIFIGGWDTWMQQFNEDQTPYHLVLSKGETIETALMGWHKSSLDILMSRMEIGKAAAVASLTLMLLWQLTKQPVVGTLGLCTSMFSVVPVAFALEYFSKHKKKEKNFMENIWGCDLW